MTNTPHAFNRLRQFRPLHGLTQAELAERAGISRTAVTAIEGHRLVPSVAAASTGQAINAAETGELTHID